MAKTKSNRKATTKQLLKSLAESGVSEVEIAFRTNACPHSVWLWANKGRVPSPAYFNALVSFAASKGIKV